MESTAAEIKPVPEAETELEFEREALSDILAMTHRS